MLKIKRGEFHLSLVKDLPVGHLSVPFYIIHAVHALEIHGNPFQAVGDFNGDRMQFNAAGKLKIRKLGDFHAVQPYLPSKPACSERRRLPVIFHKPDIMFQGIKMKPFQAFQVQVLDFYG